MSISVVNWTWSPAAETLPVIVFEALRSDVKEEAQDVCGSFVTEGLQLLAVESRRSWVSCGLRVGSDTGIADSWGRSGREVGGACLKGEPKGGEGGND